LTAKQRFFADVDGDGAINFWDRRIVQGFIGQVLTVADLPIVAGDVFTDGKLDARDTTMIRRHIEAVKNGQPSPLTAKQRFLADVDGDGAINFWDRRIVQGFIGQVLAVADLPALAGDVYTDGRRDARDTTLILRHIDCVKNGTASPLTPKQQFLADIDGNGAVTEVDAQLSRMLIVGSIEYSGIETYVRIAQFAELVKDRAADVNGDKQVDQQDIAVVSEGYTLVLDNLKMISGSELLLTFDWNRDGMITQDDAEGYRVSIQTYIETREKIERFAERLKNAQEDKDNDGNLDIDEQALAAAAFSTWTANGVFDVDNDGTMSAVNEDVNGNGKLDAALDINGDVRINDTDYMEIMEGYALVLNNLNLLNEEEKVLFDQNRDGIVNYGDASFVADNIRAHFSGNDTGSGAINKRAMITRKMLNEMALKNGIFTAKQPLDEATLSPKMEIKMKEPVR
jgi:hypothetical protein